MTLKSCPPMRSTPNWGEEVVICTEVRAWKSGGVHCVAPTERLMPGFQNNRYFRVRASCSSTFPFDTTARTKMSSPVMRVMAGCFPSSMTWTLTAFDFSHLQSPSLPVNFLPDRLLPCQDQILPAHRNFPFHCCPACLNRCLRRCRH